MIKRPEGGGKRFLSQLLLVCASWCMEALPLTVVAQETEGDGLTGQYFNAYDTFTGTPVLTRIDPQVNFNWLLDAPIASMPIDEFSVKWSGMVKAPSNEVYTFTTNSDDGVRLVVNGKVLIDKLVDQQESKWSGSIALQAGKKYSIELYYIERRSIALCQLSWSSPFIPLQLIPKTYLYHEIDVNNGGNTTALEIEELSRSFRLYPIPASSRLHIQLTNGVKHPDEIKIFSMLGKDITSIQTAVEGEELIAEIGDLDPGTYVLQVGEHRKLFCKK